MAALTFYEAASREDPYNIEATRSLAFLQLRLGNLKEGWGTESLRLENKTFKAQQKLNVPFWNGENLLGKSLLITFEEGIGDQILQASMLHSVLSKETSYLIACEERLVPLLQRSFPLASAKSYQNIIVDNIKLDYQIPAINLGKHVRPYFSSYPQKQVSFIKPNDKLCKLYREKYIKKFKSHPLVGVTWNSNSSGYKKSKSLTLEGLQPIFDRAQMNLVSLQYGPVSKKLDEFEKKTGTHIYCDDTVDQLKDLEAFFAQVSAMDLVITISNTTAHVAGALGIPTWLILPRGAGEIWYWFTERSDSPWYPSVKLFRQKSSVGAHTEWWSDAVDEIASSLPSWLNSLSKESSP
jgi:hypothetical protein